MGVRYDILSVDRLVVTTAFGEVNGQELIENLLNLANDTAFDPTSNHIFNTKQVKSVDVAPAVLKRLAGIELFADTSRRAVVASSDVIFGLARIYEAYRDVSTDRLRIFREYDQAMSWLQEENGAGEIDKQ